MIRDGRSDHKGRLLIVAFDPGVTTGWSWHCASKEGLLTLGAVSSLRDMRKDIPIIEMSEFGRGLDLGYEIGQIEPGVGEWAEDSVTDQQMWLVRKAFVAYDFDPTVDTLAVVTEDFILRMESRDRALLAPVRLNAKLERELRGPGFSMFLQSASDAKNVVTDARLKHWNVYEAGMQHGRDAQRHAILFMRRWASQDGLRKATEAQMRRHLARRQEAAQNASQGLSAGVSITSAGPLASTG